MRIKDDSLMKNVIIETREERHWAYTKPYPGKAALNEDLKRYQRYIPDAYPEVMSASLLKVNY